MLQIDDTFRVQIDSSHQNFILEKYDKVKVKGTDEHKYEWLQLGFHGLSLRSVLHSYMKHKLADEVEVNGTVELLVSKINQLERNIDKISKTLVFEVKSNDKTV